MEAGMTAGDRRSSEELSMFFSLYVVLLFVIFSRSEICNLAFSVLVGSCFL